MRSERIDIDLDSGTFDSILHMLYMVRVFSVYGFNVDKNRWDSGADTRERDCQSVTEVYDGLIGIVIDEEGLDL